VTGGELGGEQGIPEGQVAAVDRHNGGASGCSVTQHDRNAVADAGTGVAGDAAPEKKVQLTATVSTSGVLAEEKRRVAAPRLAAARNPRRGRAL